MPLAIPWALDPGPAVPGVESGSVDAYTALAARRYRSDEAAAAIARIVNGGQRDVAATAALNLATVETAVRAVTGRPSDVLLAAAVYRAGSAVVTLCRARRVSDGRTFTAAIP